VKLAPMVPRPASSLNVLTGKPEEQTTSRLPFRHVEVPCIQPQHRSTITLPNDLNGLVELEG